MMIFYNQLGFKPKDKKIAYVKDYSEKPFKVIDMNEAVIYEGISSKAIYDEASEDVLSELDFTEVTKPGLYYILCQEISQLFSVGESVYDNLYDKSIRYLENAKCGIENKDKHFHHPACHTKLARLYGEEKYIDVSGGLHDAGDYGRYVVPGCKVILDLVFAYLENADERLLELAKYEATWLLKMQREDGALYHKVAGLGFPSLDCMPQAEEDLVVFDISTTATGDFVAALGLLAYVLKDKDLKCYELYLAALQKAYAFLECHEPILFHNPKDTITGEYVDNSDSDERFIAKAAMYLLTKDEMYFEEPKKEGSFYDYLGWADMGMYGAILYHLAGKSEYDSIIIEEAEKFYQKTSGYGISLGKEYVWGSNMIVSNNAVIMLYGYKITKEQKYYDCALKHLSYLLGANALGISYVTMMGTNYSHNPHHRLSVSLGKTESGMLVGGPCDGLYDPFVKQACQGLAKQKCYLDHAMSYSTNEVCIYWNSPLIWMLAFLK